jgi:hypothetical protein
MTDSSRRSDACSLGISAAATYMIMIKNNFFGNAISRAAIVA